MSIYEKSPPIKKGWMRKQGRSGLVKNWKTRYFVLGDGKLSYYLNDISEHPYGHGLKGELNLVNSEVVDEHTKTVNEKQVFVVSYNGENNILVETDDPKETVEWANAIKSHIAFYNKASTSRVQSMTISRSGSNPPAPATFVAPAASTSSIGDEHVEDVNTKTNETTHLTPHVGESKRSSIARRQVVSSNDATESVSNPPVLEYQVFTVDVIANKLLDLVVNFFTNSEDRNKILKEIIPTVQTAVINATENIIEGETGKRGEKVVITAGILFFLIIVGVGNRYLFYLINLFIYIAATALITAGVTILFNSVWELKDHFSLLLIPSPGNKVVTTGVYQLVRHPMYAGVIMISFGWSISQKEIYKIVLSMILFIVLNYAAEKEEEFLEKKHPKTYPLYANTKRALIPFLY